MRCRAWRRRSKHCFECALRCSKLRNRVSQDAGFMRQLECHLAHARELQSRSRAERQCYHELGRHLIMLNLSTIDRRTYYASSFGRRQPRVDSCLDVKQGPKRKILTRERSLKARRDPSDKPTRAILLHNHMSPSHHNISPSHHNMPHIPHTKL